MKTSLISAERLKKEVKTTDFLIFDASWYMPTEKRDTRAEYLCGHLPGAKFFDIDGLSSHPNELPHMLAEKGSFEKQLRTLGLKQGQTVVVYDTAGIFSAPRAWWMLKVFGISDVRVLDGGLPAWVATGEELEVGLQPVVEGDVSLISPGREVSGVDAILHNIKYGDRQIIDARGAARFTGEEADPRAGVSPGHIPGSINLPFAKLLTQTGHLRQESELREAFSVVGIDLSRPLTASCGSGVTAAILILALTQLGHNDLNLYDGSWAEWGALPHTEKAQGPA
ncbi:3-mercaptopyruvate sulfurtransferase [Serratia sp. M24T3]|uniref:3-mercaptopyruvate sulfurtransferase n=1 Tax=Serratia sp. M24T3 TaxID=932213 RepID=UPI00025BB67F|nr:3-mercaptopyruvate sulfurtransferase [Serratia sp. M24T3]EIC83092.1 3-mercaptopyruvate sulfurtransferase [Serratia sp. M24T3]